MERRELDFWACTDELLRRMRHEGVLCTVVDNDGRTNLLTLGWGLLGPMYHGCPILAIAITPLRYSWRFIEEVPEFVIGVPGDGIRAGVDLCGRESGRDMDKFAAAGLTPVPALHVRPPAIAECPVNIECRVYAPVAPPHMLLTPEHRRRPPEQQHTIYFAEVLSTYGWEDT